MGRELLIRADVFRLMEGRGIRKAALVATLDAAGPGHPVDSSEECQPEKRKGIAGWVLCGESN